MHGLLLEGLGFLHSHLGAGIHGSSEMHKGSFQYSAVNNTKINRWCTTPPSSDFRASRLCRKLVYRSQLCPKLRFKCYLDVIILLMTELGTREALRSELSTPRAGTEVLDFEQFPLCLDFPPAEWFIFQQHWNWMIFNVPSNQTSPRLYDSIKYLKSNTAYLRRIMNREVLQSCLR